MATKNKKTCVAAASGLAWFTVQLTHGGSVTLSAVSKAEAVGKHLLQHLGAPGCALNPIKGVRPATLVERLVARVAERNATNKVPTLWRVNAGKVEWGVTPPNYGAHWFPASYPSACLLAALRQSPAEAREESEGVATRLALANDDSWRTRTVSGAVRVVRGRSNRTANIAASYLLA